MVYTARNLTAKLGIFLFYIKKIVPNLFPLNILQLEVVLFKPTDKDCLCIYLFSTHPLVGEGLQLFCKLNAFAHFLGNTDGLSFEGTTGRVCPWYPIRSPLTLIPRMRKTIKYQ